MQKSTQNRLGRYTQGGKTTDLKTRLGWWERKPLERSASDISLTITPKYAFRPDRLAYDMYGRADLQWLILQFNNVNDVHIDFATGKTITVPTKERVFRELLSTSQQ